MVFGTGFEKAEETFDNGSGGMMSFKVDERFIRVLRWRGDVRRFLSIVDKIASINACFHVSAINDEMSNIRLTNERNTSLVTSPRLHLRTQIMKVLEWLNEFLQFSESPLISHRNILPRPLEPRTVGQ